MYTPRLRLRVGEHERDATAGGRERGGLLARAHVPVDSREHGEGPFETLDIRGDSIHAKSVITYKNRSLKTDA